ncbi:hypothetical protein [Pectobacterium parmentieri]|uniref:hypothetical protein n=1 Tax=Pectobacterium parmentieri TaxID=1905730 RepID=UPI0001B100ED
MFKTHPSTKQNTQRIMEIWRKAVDVTHHFLAIKDRSAIKKELILFFPTVELALRVNQQDKQLVSYIYMTGIWKRFLYIRIIMGKV